MLIFLGLMVTGNWVSSSGKMMNFDIKWKNRILISRRANLEPVTNPLEAVPIKRKNSHRYSS
jgi:hypothetical protein